MNTPTPHHSFPHGETLPFSVEVHTDETGAPHVPSLTNSYGSYKPNTLIRRLVLELARQAPMPRDADPRHWNLMYEPTTARYATELTTHHSTDYFVRGGLYRYRILLELRQTDSYGSPLALRVSYTLHQGTLSLY